MFYYIKRVRLNFLVYSENDVNKPIYSCEYDTAIGKNAWYILFDEKRKEIGRIECFDNKFIYFGYKRDHKITLFTNDIITEIKLIQISWFRPQWRLDFKGNQFEFVVNRNCKYSVFKNGKQIAGIIQKQVEFLDSSRYVLELKNIQDLVILLCMFFNAKEDDTNEQSTVTVDIGNPFCPKFNERWKNSITE